MSYQSHFNYWCQIGKMSSKVFYSNDMTISTNKIVSLSWKWNIIWLNLVINNYAMPCHAIQCHAMPCHARKHFFYQLFSIKFSILWIDFEIDLWIQNNFVWNFFFRSSHRISFYIHVLCIHFNRNNLNNCILICWGF